MKVWILLFLLLKDTTSHAQTPSVASNDDIRMIRAQVAGRVEVFTEGEWRAVCHASWDERDARVACRQLGFSDKGAIACGSSCLGRSTLKAGFHNFRCNGNESRLTDCPRNPNKGCGQDAGVTCNVITTTSSPVVTLSPLTTQQGQCTPVTTTIIQQSFTSRAQEGCKEETCNCTALGGGLGGVTALLALLLVLVVLGWVCSCYRRQGRSVIIKERDNSGTDHGRFFNNPNYDTVVPSEAHQYSLNGPRDMPLSSGAQPPDAIYDAVTTSDGKDHTQEVGGVGLYSTYDVITTDIDHRDEDNTEEAAPYLVVAKSQKEGDHTEEEAALYSVVTEPQDISIIPEEYSKLHH